MEPKERFSLRFVTKEEKKLYEKLRKYAFKNKMSMAAMVKVFIQRALILVK